MRCVVRYDMHRMLFLFEYKKKELLKIGTVFEYIESLTDRKTENLIFMPSCEAFFMQGVPQMLSLSLA